MVELHVRAVSARNLLVKQTFGKQDPFCKLELGHQSLRTRVHDNGHRTPFWNEKFVFQVCDIQLDQLHIVVKDKTFALSTLIGECYLPVSMLLHGEVTDQWYPLQNGSQAAGEINIRMQLTGLPMKNPQPKNANAASQNSAIPKDQAYPGQKPNKASAPSDINQYPQASAYPAASYPAQGYPGQTPQNYPPQNYPPQVYPPQGYPPQGYPQQGYPPHNYPPQAYPPQGYPPQGQPPQGYPYGYAAPPAMYPAAPGAYGHTPNRGGSNMGNVAMGAGAGLLGGLLLGEALDDGLF